MEATLDLQDPPGTTDANVCASLALRWSAKRRNANFRVEHEVVRVAIQAILVAETGLATHIEHAN
jgi:hypothetical protein